MIERISIKNNHLFKDIELEFDKNLIIFSGASGSGKSVFMNLLLTLFGFKDEQSSLIEATVRKKLDLEEFGIENEEENIFRRVTSKSSRYFINGSQLSKKNILSISKSFINYLNLREFSEFENKNLISLLDSIAKKIDSNHDSLLNEFNHDYTQYKDISKQLQSIEEKEKKIEDLKEFAKFEIEKIESVNPKIGEYEELLTIKKKLSKKEKIESAIESASMIYEFEGKVIDALNLLDEDSTFFSEAINELNIKLESARENLSELEDIDIEELLNRLEDLSSLKNKYGSIEEALEYLQEKKKELASYENISFEKKELQDKKQSLEKSLTKLANSLSKSRKEALKHLNQDINSYTKLLYLKEITFNISQTPLCESGFDEVTLNLGGTSLQKVSSGELNRIRLSFLATSAKYIQNGGVLILDEIDANLSGKESDAVAKVLYELSSNYQIFAISHQPQLSSYANEHYVVSKDGENSTIKKLNESERVEELARMISGKDITKEAKEFAKKLLKERV